MPRAGYGAAMAPAPRPRSGDRRALLRALPGVLLVVLAPLAYAPGAQSPFHAAKWLVVCVLVPGGLAVAAATGRLRWPLARWWAAWLGVLALATLTGVAPWLSLVGSPGRSDGLIAAVLGAGAFVLGASTGDDPAVARRILRAAFVTGGVVGLIAIVERLGLDLPGVGDPDHATRARSTWGSATFLGGYLVLVAPLALVHLRAADRRWRNLALASSVTMGIALVLTGTRGAWLGAVAAVAVLVPVWRQRADGPAPHRWNPVVLGALAVGGILLAGLAVTGPTLDRASGGGRIDLWRTVAPVIGDRPLLGSGPDTQRIVLPAGIDDDFERDHGSDELHDRAHDLVLDTWVTSGLVGVLALGGLLVAITRRVVQRLGDQAIARAIAAGLVAYLVHLLFAFGEATLDPLVWLLAGLLVAALPAPEADDEPVGDQPARMPAWTVGVLGAVAVAGLLWGAGDLVADVRLARAIDQDAAGDRLGALATLEGAGTTAPGRFDLWQVRSRVAQRLLTGGSPTSGTPDPRRDGTAAAALLADALADLDRAEQIAPGDPDLLLDRAALLDAAGRHADAQRAFERVLDGPYPSSSRAQLGLGTAAIARGDAERAIAAWERAATLDPDDTRALDNLGTLHLQSGRTDEAVDAYRRALARDPNDGIARQALTELGEPVPGD